jgi:hypothetical protein
VYNSGFPLGQFQAGSLEGRMTISIAVSLRPCDNGGEENLMSLMRSVGDILIKYGLTDTRPVKFDSEERHYIICSPTKINMDNLRASQKAMRACDTVELIIAEMSRIGITPYTIEMSYTHGEGSIQYTYLRGE